MRLRCACSSQAEETVSPIQAARQALDREDIDRVGLVRDALRSPPQRTQARLQSSPPGCLCAYGPCYCTPASQEQALGDLDAELSRLGQASATAEAKAAQLESAVATAKDQLLRLNADFDNFRRRSVSAQGLSSLLQSSHGITCVYTAALASTRLNCVCVWCHAMARSNRRRMLWLTV